MRRARLFLKHPLRCGAGLFLIHGTGARTAGIAARAARAHGAALALRLLATDGKT